VVRWGVYRTDQYYRLASGPPTTLPGATRFLQLFFVSFEVEDSLIELGWANNASGGPVVGPILVDGAKRDRLDGIALG
jgi:hypothetical protein